MKENTRYSVDAARVAADRGELGAWVAAFLASSGSDNPLLAEELSRRLAWWAGPTLLPLDQLARLAGPPGAPVVCQVEEGYWDERVDAIESLAEEGWEPPPVIVSWSGDQLILEDGNHRVEGVRQAGRQTVWAVVGFERQEDRDRFAINISRTEQ